MSLGVRHVVRRRKKLREEKETFEPISVLKTALDILIYPVAFVAPLALVPQVWRLYATHDASSLSLSTWVLLTIFNLMWIFYALVHREKPVLVANTMFGVLNLAIVLGVVLFR